VTRVRGPARSRLVEEGGDQVAEFDGALRVGRHPLNDLAVEHPRISSHHAAIEWDGEGWRLVDLGSRNGTSLNRRRLRGSRRLKEGDRIRFASVSGWRVERLVPPSAGPGCVATEPVPAAVGGADLELQLRFTGPDEGLLVVRHDGRSWSAAGRQRFILLHLLARAGGGWVDDEELRRQLWGRVGAARMTGSALHKLIHDTRALFRERGVTGVVLEKKRGRTRLAVPPDRVSVREEGPT